MNNDRTALAVDNTHFKKITSMVRSDEHGEAVIEALNSDRIAKRVNHAVFSDPMLPCTGRNRRDHSVGKLACGQPFVNHPWSRGLP